MQTPLSIESRARALVLTKDDPTGLRKRAAEPRVPIRFR